MRVEAVVPRPPSHRAFLFQVMPTYCGMGTHFHLVQLFMLRGLSTRWAGVHTFDTFDTFDTLLSSVSFIKVRASQELPHSFQVLRQTKLQQTPTRTRLSTPSRNMSTLFTALRHRDTQDKLKSKGPHLNVTHKKQDAPYSSQLTAHTRTR